MLDELFGQKFRQLPELEGIILITAATEGFVQHARIKEISSEHSKDITSALAHLVQKNMLEKEGETRGSMYYLPGKRLPDTNSLFSDNEEMNSPDLGLNSPDLKKKFLSCLQSMGYDKMPGKLNSENMKKIILELCEDDFLSLKDLAKFLQRDPKSIQEQYLTPFLTEGLLELKYPDTKNHPNQAYRSKK